MSNVSIISKDKKSSFKIVALGYFVFKVGNSLSFNSINVVPLPGLG